RPTTSLRDPHLKMDRIGARVSRGEVKSRAEEGGTAHGAPKPARSVERRAFVVFGADLGGGRKERGRGSANCPRYGRKSRFERRHGRAPRGGALEPRVGRV